ncbi:polyketide cyclase/dehydrase/lipid transport protein [Paraburkholderia sp. BL25I1N1]|nr:polyketide cyclase/dehydrase/lipid transport protein [Paraburkholderia sp. BL25I1N1]
MSSNRVTHVEFDSVGDDLKSRISHSGRSILRRSIATAASAAVLVVFGVLPGSASATDQQTATASANHFPARTMSDDLANRSAEIHWPKGFEPTNADLFSHNETHIDASCERVWVHIVDANDWPKWYPNSHDVRIIGQTDDPKKSALGAQSVFRWTTFGLPLESRINEYTPYSRIGWYGYAPGTAPSFYHTWNLKPQGNGCLVVMDEVGKGPDATRLRETDEALMHRGHDLWLATLKWVSESD